MSRRSKWVDLALLPFGLCVAFLLILGKLFGFTYKQISVIFNLWVQGAVLALSGLVPLGVALYKLYGTFSASWLLVSMSFAIYGGVYVYAFIKMLQHYHLPFNYAFDLCVADLVWLATKWRTTYQIVNLIIFVLFYLMLLGLNAYIYYFLCSLKN